MIKKHVFERFFHSLKPSRSFGNSVFISSIVWKRRQSKIRRTELNQANTEQRNSNDVSRGLGKNQWKVGKNQCYCIDAFETQNMLQNVLSWSKRYSNTISEICCCQSTIFKHQTFGFFVGGRWWSSRAQFVFKAFSARFELFVPLSLITKGLPQYF